MLIPLDDFDLVLQQIASAFETQIRPGLESATSKDSAAHISRLLVMLSVAASRSTELEKDYRDALAEGLALAPEFVRIGFSSAEEVTSGDFTTLRADLQDLVPRLRRVEPPDRKAVADFIRTLVAMESRLQDGIAASRNEIVTRLDQMRSPVGEHDDIDVSPIMLKSYLRANVEDANHVEVLSTGLISGGRSKQTIIVEVTGAPALPAKFILRKDRVSGIVDSATADEFKILSVVHDEGGIPVPRPLWVEYDPTKLGGTCMAVSLLEGSLEGEYHLDVRKPISGHRELVVQMAEILARIHSIPLEKFGRAKLNADPDLRGRLAARTQAIAGQFASAKGQPSVGAAIAAQWLEDHSDWGMLAQPRFIHGDFGLHNLLIDAGRITGVLDWELAGIASPASDIAMCHRLTAYLDINWDDFVDAYRAAGGPADACDPRCVVFYRVLGLASGTVRSRYGGHLLRSGQRRDLIVANSGYDYHFRSSRLLADALRDALDLPSA